MPRFFAVLALSVLCVGCATHDDGGDRRRDAVRESEARRREMHRRVDDRIDEAMDRLRDEMHRMIDASFDARVEPEPRDRRERMMPVAPEPRDNPDDRPRPNPAPRRGRRNADGAEAPRPNIPPSEGSGDDPLDFDRMLERAKREAGFEGGMVLEIGPDSRPATDGGTRMRRVVVAPDSRPMPRRRFQ